MEQDSTLFRTFVADFRKVVRHKKTKSVIETHLVIKFSQNLNTQKGRVATTLTLWIYTFLKRENYIPQRREWLLLTHLRRQCEKPDNRVSIDTVLTLFAYNNFNVPMGDEGQMKLHIAMLVGPYYSYSYSQTQIDEYINRGLSNFMKLGGNIPFTDFIKRDKWESAKTDIPVNERFYLAKQPFAYCGVIKADYEYRSPIFSEKDCAPITGLNLISLTTHKTTCLDVRNLLIRGRFINGEIYSSKGTINTYIFNLIKNAIPYITLREVLQGLVQFIGNRHIYFEIEIVRGEKYVKWSSEPIPCSSRILNGYFAENVCYTSR